VIGLIKLCPLDVMMTTEELETIISTYTISKPIVGGDGENKALASMLTVFRDLINNEVPPTQQNYVNEFTNRYPDVDINCINSRLKRAYFSYIREYHLGYLLKEHFDKVIYNEKTDLEGVDYVVEYKDNKINLHAYVNTKNGRYWRNIKNSRHNFKGIHFDLPMVLSNGKRCGKFLLYTDKDIVDLKKRLDKFINGFEARAVSN
jgi:hypothetical protein